jgi:hypothetical protein
VILLLFFEASVTVTGAGAAGAGGGVSTAAAGCMAAWFSLALLQASSPSAGTSQISRLPPLAVRTGSS